MFWVEGREAAQRLTRIEKEASTGIDEKELEGCIRIGMVLQDAGYPHSEGSASSGKGRSGRTAVESSRVDFVTNSGGDLKQARAEET